jgi:hypothetical protein
VVATGSQVPVVAISAPGVYLSSRGFGINHDSLKYIVIDVIHENDVVPKLDRLTGSIFTLGCGATNPFICHQPGQTICELLCHCGGSKAFSQCLFFMPTKLRRFREGGLRSGAEKGSRYISISARCLMDRWERLASDRTRKHRIGMYHST